AGVTAVFGYRRGLAFRFRGDLAAFPAVPLLGGAADYMLRPDAPPIAQPATQPATRPAAHAAAAATSAATTRPATLPATRPAVVGNIDFAGSFTGHRFGVYDLAAGLKCVGDVRRLAAHIDVSVGS